MASLRCLFIVQGEGRGHLTQALALQAVLQRAGHTVAGVIVGQNRERRLPPFVRQQMAAPVHRVPSPTFVADAARRGIRLGATVWNGLRHLRRLPKRLDPLEALLRHYRPDVVVNFFEPLAGLLYGLRAPGPPMVSIAHQYMFLHSAYTFPPGWPISRRAAQGFARLTAWGATRRIALALDPAPDEPAHRLTVLPPLLRPAVFDARVETEPFLLVYLLNRGYIDEVRRWHARHPQVRIHGFVDRPGAPPVERLGKTLTLHQLDGARFLSMMARCQGLACTAGFESVAEARYFGKPVQVVPVAGHFEQHCNAWRIERTGIGRWTARFDLDPLVRAVHERPGPDAAFRDRVRRGRRRIVEVMEEAAAEASAPRYELAGDADGASVVLGAGAAGD